MTGVGQGGRSELVEVLRETPCPLIRYMVVLRVRGVGKSVVRCTNGV